MKESEKNLTFSTASPTLDRAPVRVYSETSFWPWIEGALCRENEGDSSTLKRICYRFLAFCLLIIPFFTLSTSQAQADGGAPNVAYIAGTSHGISVIDILQQKVTRTLAVDGDPHTILLSLDGRFLYATQPAVGRVAIIAARTGQTFCSANLPGHPTLLALGSDTVTLYTADNEGNISVIDSMTCMVRETFETHDGVNGLAT